MTRQDATLFPKHSVLLHGQRTETRYPIIMIRLFYNYQGKPQDTASGAIVWRNRSNPSKATFLLHFHYIFATTHIRKREEEGKIETDGLNRLTACISLSCGRAYCDQHRGVLPPCFYYRRWPSEPQRSALLHF